MGDPLSLINGLGVALCTAGAALYHAHAAGYLDGRRLNTASARRACLPGSRLRGWAAAASTTPATPVARGTIPAGGARRGARERMLHRVPHALDALPPPRSPLHPPPPVSVPRRASAVTDRRRPYNSQAQPPAAPAGARPLPVSGPFRRPGAGAADTAGREAGPGSDTTVGIAGPGSDTAGGVTGPAADGAGGGDDPAPGAGAGLRPPPAAQAALGGLGRSSSSPCVSEASALAGHPIQPSLASGVPAPGSACHVSPPASAAAGSVRPPAAAERAPALRPQTAEVEMLKHTLATVLHPATPLAAPPAASPVAPSAPSIACVPDACITIVPATGGAAAEGAGGALAEVSACRPRIDRRTGGDGLC